MGLTYIIRKLEPHYNFDSNSYAYTWPIISRLIEGFPDPEKLANVKGVSILDLKIIHKVFSNLVAAGGLERGLSQNDALWAYGIGEASVKRIENGDFSPEDERHRLLRMHPHFYCHNFKIVLALAERCSDGGEKVKLYLKAYENGRKAIIFSDEEDKKYLACNHLALGNTCRNIAENSKNPSIKKNWLERSYLHHMDAVGMDTDASSKMLNICLAAKSVQSLYGMTKKDEYKRIIEDAYKKFKKILKESRCCSSSRESSSKHQRAMDAIYFSVVGDPSIMDQMISSRKNRRFRSGRRHSRHSNEDWSCEMDA